MATIFLFKINNNNKFNLKIQQQQQQQIKYNNKFYTIKKITFLSTINKTFNNFKIITKNTKFNFNSNCLINLKMKNNNKHHHNRIINI